MNLVNAAGGLVANGLNLANASAAITSPNITQSNSISQHH
jgi:hypothetical protein